MMKESITSLSNYSHLLHSCKNLNSLRQIHARLLIQSSPVTSNSILTLLLNLYSSFNQPTSALSTFNSSTDPDTKLFNSIVRCFTRANEPRKAIKLYNAMMRKGLEPDKYSFTFVLKACVSAHNLRVGRLVHGEIVRRGLVHDVFIGTGLVDLYAKLGLVETAHQVFNSMLVLDAVSWNAMIAGFSQNGRPYRALELFRKMHSLGVELNSVTFLNLFPSICGLCDVMLCKRIHGFISRRSFLHLVFNGLIDAYSKCGEIEYARKIFDGMMGFEDDVSWATMISGYVYNNRFHEALDLFDEMMVDDSKLNQVSVASALSAAAKIRDIDRGKIVHDHAIKKGIDFDVPTTTVLMTMYAKCGEIEKAKLLFKGIRNKDIVAWSAIISALVQMGCPKDAVFIFQEMQIKGFVPNKVTVVTILPACGDLRDVKLGKSIHCYVLRSGIEIDVSIGTALVSMYAQCELFAQAHVIFDRLSPKEVVTWNALINGYAQIGDAINALEMFQKLRSTGQSPDPGTMVGVLPACSQLSNLYLGSSVQGLNIKYGHESDFHVKNATIDMYAKCSNLPSAEILFSEMKSHKDIITWNSMIAGYMHIGNSKEGISAFHEMRAKYLKPNPVTLVSIIPAVANLASLRDGLALHCIVIRLGYEAHVLIGNSLIDMYAKCGRIDHSRDFFNSMSYKDTVSWNVMLSAYATHGLSENCIELFREMKQNGITSDSLSIVSVLSACRHGGLVEEGEKIFKSIESELKLEPRMEHYSCMVDLLGRNGKLDEAWGLIQRMPMEADGAIWGALLGACRMHSNVKIGEIAVENLVRLEPHNPAHYVALSNIYAQVGRWADARKTREAMSNIGMSKIPGCSRA